MAIKLPRDSMCNRMTNLQIFRHSIDSLITAKTENYPIYKQKYFLMKLYMHVWMNHCIVLELVHNNIVIKRPNIVHMRRKKKAKATLAHMHIELFISLRGGERNINEMRCVHKYTLINT